ncbi:hypothetical protein AK812_SmicGene23230 [Symbiodinium microadriaticum]|uniref:Uncharacterized protein n=1 Tax=Symbiodinium microadriaticum TaxID=2951 RepID=A0A1Q9DHR4_SYMMI|nr:hypothetical protein AK812_SmicGene23230 [Symbiodinium microadriaticum]
MQQVNSINGEDVALVVAARQQESRQSKLLEEEIEVIDRAHRVYVMSAILSYAEPEALIHPWATQDFSGTPFVTFVAWITHRGLARAPMCCAAAFDWPQADGSSVLQVARPPNVDVDWAAQETELVEDRRLQGDPDANCGSRKCTGNRLYKHSDIFLA